MIGDWARKLLPACQSLSRYPVRGKKPIIHSLLWHHFYPNQQGSTPCNKALKRVTLNLNRIYMINGRWMPLSYKNTMFMARGRHTSLLSLACMQNRKWLLLFLLTWGILSFKRISVSLINFSTVQVPWGKYFMLYAILGYLNKIDLITHKGEKRSSPKAWL